MAIPLTISRADLTAAAACLGLDPDLCRSVHLTPHGVEAVIMRRSTSGSLLVFDDEVATETVLIPVEASRVIWNHPGFHRGSGISG